MPKLLLLKIESKKDKMVLYKKNVRQLAINFIAVLLVLVISFIGVNYFRKNISDLKEEFILVTTKKPEVFTELYFENHSSLPSKIDKSEENTFQFTIGNHEEKNKEYLYEVFLELGQDIQVVGEGIVFIKKDEYKTISEQFYVKKDIPRIKVVVSLIDKNQQIHFWMEY